MRKVFLVTGFNNWGKTHIIGAAFGRKAFPHNKLHQFQRSGCDFMVMPYSNDDLGLRRYCDQYDERMITLKQELRIPKYIVSAFCPTKELEWRTKGGPKDRTSIDIITELYGGDEVHMLLLVHKWCGHAELHPAEIKSFYSGLPNVTVTTIAPATYVQRLVALTAAINARLP